MAGMTSPHGDKTIFSCYVLHINVYIVNKEQKSNIRIILKYNTRSI